MVRFVSLLLIPFFVLGQALPHSHAGTGMVEPDGHALRPHLHLHSHDHHHHHGDEHHHHHAEVQDPGAQAAGISAGIFPVPDHDADALYLAASGPPLTPPSPSIPIEVPVAGWDALITPLATGFDAQRRYRTSDPPDPLTTLPIYLLTASLRL
ncbi:MAG: hypothetical protein ACF788_03125 [Novipirellula sp. JB048]